MKLYENYSPKEIEKILWNIFKTDAKSITLKSVDNDIYTFLMVPEDSFTLNKMNDVLGEMWDSDLFDLDVASNGDITIKFQKEGKLNDEPFEDRVAKMRGESGYLEEDTTKGQTKAALDQLQSSIVALDKAYTFEAEGLGNAVDIQEQLDRIKDATNIIAGLVEPIDMTESISRKEKFLKECFDDIYGKKSLNEAEVARPARMARPDITGMTKNANAYWSHLYIQDEARSIFQDKYGKERGEKMWEGSINSNYAGAMYQAVTNIVMEKAKMLQELGEARGGDYFEKPYLDVWSRWMTMQNRPIPSPKVAAPVVPQAAPTIQKAPVAPQQPNNILKSAPASQTSSFDSKDEMRISDIIKKAAGDRSKSARLAQVMASKITDIAKAVRRGNAAESENYHDLASIFFKRAYELAMQQKK